MTRIYRSLDEIQVDGEGRSSVIAFGSFDGLHRAHRGLIARVRDEAKRRNATGAVLSFSNHPLSILAPSYAPKLLLSPERKIEVLKELGIDVIVLPEFTHELSRLPARRFVREILIERLAMRHIICGYDCRFGNGAKGDGLLLEEMGRELDFTVEILPPWRDGGAIIGSRVIRQLILLGEVERAAGLLERPHELTGVVVEGDHRGRQLGYPTANLRFPVQYLLPATGVYAIWADVLGHRYGGMMNLGCRPTFDHTTLSPEAHLFDFDEETYGEEMTVYFLRQLRKEKRFDGPEDLKRQLEADRVSALEVLRGY